MGRNNFPIFPFLFKQGFFFFWLQLLVVPASQAQHKKHAPAPTPLINASRNDILKNSQISYRAEGGFTGIHSYSVIVTCVRGKISTLQSIHDPRIRNGNSHLRRAGRMDKVSYLNLWKSLNNLAVLNIKDAPNPKMDILDEFTVKFEARAGDYKNTFKVYGCGRPEAARYYAVKNIIDQSVDMRSLWATHSRLAKK